MVEADFKEGFLWKLKLPTPPAAPFARSGSQGWWVLCLESWQRNAKIVLPLSIIISPPSYSSTFCLVLCPLFPTSPQIFTSLFTCIWKLISFCGCVSPQVPPSPLIPPFPRHRSLFTCENCCSVVATSPLSPPPHLRPSFCTLENHSHYPHAHLPQSPPSLCLTYSLFLYTKTTSLLYSPLPSHLHHFYIYFKKKNFKYSPLNLLLNLLKILTK